MIDLAQVLLLVFGLVLIPIALILATPFVWLWPRSDEETSYLRTVGRRYLRVVNALSHLGNAIG